MYISPNFNFLVISVNLILKIKGTIGEKGRVFRIVRENSTEEKRKIIKIKEQMH